MSNFQTTVVENAKSITTSDGTVTVDLPNANPLSRIYVRIATTGTAPTAKCDLVEVLVDGSPVIAGLTSDDLLNILKFDTGRTYTDNGATLEVPIMFGRFARDEAFALPAPLFNNVQLKLKIDYGGTVTESLLTVVVEEILGVDPKKLVLRKRSLVDTWTPAAASEIKDVKLPLGNRIAGIYLDYADADNVKGDLIQLGVNNFTRRIWNAPLDAIIAFNKLAYNFHDDAAPTDVVYLDFDLFGSIGKAMPTQGLSDLKLRLKSQTGYSGTARVIVEEYIPVA